MDTLVLPTHDNEVMQLVESCMDERGKIDIEAIKGKGYDQALIYDLMNAYFVATAKILATYRKERKALESFIYFLDEGNKMHDRKIKAAKKLVALTSVPQSTLQTYANFEEGLRFLPNERSKSQGSNVDGLVINQSKSTCKSNSVTPHQCSSTPDLSPSKYFKTELPENCVREVKSCNCLNDNSVLNAKIKEIEITKTITRAPTPFPEEGVNMTDILEAKRRALRERDVYGIPRNQVGRNILFRSDQQLSSTDCEDDDDLKSAVIRYNRILNDDGETCEENGDFMEGEISCASSTPSTFSDASPSDSTIKEYVKIEVDNTNMYESVPSRTDSELSQNTTSSVVQLLQASSEFESSEEINQSTTRSNRKSQTSYEDFDVDQSGTVLNQTNISPPNIEDQSETIYESDTAINQSETINILSPTSTECNTTNQSELSTETNTPQPPSPEEVEHIIGQREICSMSFQMINDYMLSSNDVPTSDPTRASFLIENRQTYQFTMESITLNKSVFLFPGMDMSEGPVITELSDSESPADLLENSGDNKSRSEKSTPISSRSTSVADSIISNETF